jgi:hypothetical protein
VIVSHRHKFVFVHCRKVAGSSMKVALAPYLGDSDIVVGSLNEIIKSGQPAPPAVARILRKPRVQATALAARAMGKTWPEAQNIAAKKYFARFLGENAPHPPAESARAYLGDAWDSYRKFCFVRNPFERTASDYHWRRRSTGQDFSFSEFLLALKNRDDSRRFIHSRGVSNWDMIAIDDELQIDLVGRYESLDKDLMRITAALGLPSISLGSAEKATAKRSDYGALYGPDERRMVEEMFACEIDRFSYDFPY